MSASDGLKLKAWKEGGGMEITANKYSLIFVGWSLKFLDMAEYVILINDNHQFTIFSFKSGQWNKNR